MNGAASVPVTMGSPRFRSMALDGFDLVEAWFPPRRVSRAPYPRPGLRRHHARGLVRPHHGRSGTPLPFGRRGHRARGRAPRQPHGRRRVRTWSSSSPIPTAGTCSDPSAPLLDRPSHRHHAGIAAAAARLSRELRPPGRPRLARGGGGGAGDPGGPGPRRPRGGARAAALAAPGPGGGPRRVPRAAADRRPGAGGGRASRPPCARVPAALSDDAGVLRAEPAAGVGRRQAARAPRSRSRASPWRRASPTRVT